jgi:3-deoxy-7-phosphoheptulonate synthase
VPRHDTCHEYAAGQELTTTQLADRREAVLRHDAFDSDVEFLDLQRHPRLRELSCLPTAHQPAWRDHPDLACIRAELADLPALVDHQDIRALRRLLASVETGAAHLLHVGECAELFSMASAQHVQQRLSLYRRLADHLAGRTGRPVVLLMRMAGQHAKPRSQPFEALPDGGEIPIYSGDAINSIERTADGRKADPWRLLTSYDRSRDTLEHLCRRPDASQPVFVSHEALLKDYEEPMTRGGAVLYAGSGHLLWVGERTRTFQDWHIQWASSIANPVGVKIGPTTSGYDVIDLVQALNPRREDGRLSLIARMGVIDAAERLDSLVPVAAAFGSPVLWQCDPMHGNTRKLGGTKLRLLPDLRAEITAFVRTLRGSGCHPGGLHLEVTPEHVNECFEEVSATSGHTSCPPCDPRLNPDQAMEIVNHFADEINK